MCCEVTIKKGDGFNMRERVGAVVHALPRFWTYNDVRSAVVYPGCGFTSQLNLRRRIRDAESRGEVKRIGTDANEIVFTTC